MWSRERIAEDLRELRIREGDALIVHASMRAVGPVEGGVDTVIDALLEIVGPRGTLLAPAFNQDNYASEEWIAALQQPASSERDASRPELDAVCTRQVGILSARLCARPDARRTHHPILSFVALGGNAAFLTDNAPFHYPLGSNSPLARLHQLNDGILLLGVGHATSSALHLAEVWADVPYARRPARVKTGEDAWSEMQGSPECSAGFSKIEPILRQARLLREGYVGNAPSQYLRIQPLVSIALEILRSKQDFLLCDDPSCKWCALARKLTADRRTE